MKAPIMGIIHSGEIIMGYWDEQKEEICDVDEEAVEKVINFQREAYNHSPIIMNVMKRKNADGSYSTWRNVCDKKITNQTIIYKNY